MKQWRSDTFSPPSMRPGPGPPSTYHAACPLQRRYRSHCSLRTRMVQLAAENESLKRELESLRHQQAASPPCLTEAPARKTGPLEYLQETVQALKGRDPAQTLQEVEASLEQVWREMEPEAGEEELRNLVVQTMRMSLELWLESTRSTKAELARRSRQWSVYINDNGWERTQGLDRYLDPVTLPRNPRVKKVLQTGDFVLGSCSKPSPLYRRLEKALKRLRTTLQVKDG